MSPWFLGVLVGALALGWNVGVSIQERNQNRRRRLFRASFTDTVLMTVPVVLGSLLSLVTDGVGRMEQTAIVVMMFVLCAAWSVIRLFPKASGSAPSVIKALSVFSATAALVSVEALSPDPLRWRGGLCVGVGTLPWLSFFLSGIYFRFSHHRNDRDERKRDLFITGIGRWVGMVCLVSSTHLLIGSLVPPSFAPKGGDERPPVSSLREVSDSARIKRGAMAGIPLIFSVGLLMEHRRRRFSRRDKKSLGKGSFSSLP